MDADSAVRFTVPGTPIPWQRARSRGAQRFTAPKVREAQEAIRAFARNAGLRRPWPGSVRLELAFYRRSAQSCDLDNLTKTVLDALNGVAYEDDRQVIALTVAKCVDAARPRTEIALVRVVDDAIPLPGRGLARIAGPCASRPSPRGDRRSP